MLLNIDSRAVNANPVANIDFILTNDRSRLLFFSFSSSLSIFFLCCLSNDSPWISFLLSTDKRYCTFQGIYQKPKIFPFTGHLHFLLCFSTSPLSFWNFSVRYTSSQVRPGQWTDKRIRKVHTKVFDFLPTLS